MMKQQIIFRTVLCLLALTISFTANAAQIRVTDSGGKIGGVISSIEISRITIEGDRIASLAAVPQGFQVDHDLNTGDMYLIPQVGGLEGQIINMFVTSEAGRSFQLLLQARAVPSEQIIIRIPAAASGQGLATALESPRRQEISRLTRAMITGDFLRDYQRAAVSPDNKLVGDFGDAVIPQEAWIGEAFSGLRVTIKSEAPSLKEMPGAAAVWISADGRKGVVIFEAEGGLTDDRQT